MQRVAITLVIAAMCLLHSFAAVARDQEEPPKVAVVAPIRRDIHQTTTQPARVFPYYDAQIHAKVSGYLDELLVDIGDKVEKDQVLASISVPELDRAGERLQANIRRLQAVTRQAEAAHSIAEAQVDADLANIEAAKSELARTEAQLRADESEFHRIEQLAENKSVTTKLLDEARNRWEASRSAVATAQARLSSAEAALRISKAKLVFADAEKAVAVADVDIANKELLELQTKLEYATLRAPFAGIVTARNVDPGDLVQDAQAASPPRRPLFHIAKLDQVRLQTYVPERDAPYVQAGDPVTFLPQGSRVPVEGKVTRVAGQLDTSTGTMKVEVDLDNRDGRLLAGAYGPAVIVLENRPNSILLDATAIRFDERGTPHVLIVDADSRVKRVPLKLGFDNGREVEVLDGLTGNERIIASRIDRLAEGEKVDAVETKSE